VNLWRIKHTNCRKSNIWHACHAIADDSLASGSAIAAIEIAAAGDVYDDLPMAGSAMPAG
jgi:hypothetical protein